MYTGLYEVYQQFQIYIFLMGVGLKKENTLNLYNTL